MTQEEHNQHDRETERAIIHGVEKYGWIVPLFKAEAVKPSFGYTINQNRVAVTFW